MNDWIEKLKGSGLRQEQALNELGELLHVRVARAFVSQPKVDSAFVDDVVQDALTEILASLDQFRGESQFTSWATTLAVRIALRQIRRRRWKDTSLNQMLSKHSATVEPPTVAGDPAVRAASAQMVETMYRIIKEELTDKQREVILAHLHGMPQAEIGRRMGSNRNAIYKLGFDARKRLKDGLVAAGYSAEDLETFEVVQ